MKCGNVHDENFGGHSRHYCDLPKGHDFLHADSICGLEWL